MLAGKPIEYGHANKSKRYTGKVEIPIHILLSTGGGGRNR